MTVNKILTDSDRAILSPVIDEMWLLCPETMKRKIPEANVQQAFVLNRVRLLLRYKKDASILSVGCFEDTAFESLNNQENKDFTITGIDPVSGYDLHSFVTANDTKFDIVFATSVIEHVKDDEQFLTDMCNALSTGGYGIITTDFRDDYKQGDPLPYSDERFYTRFDLEVRLQNILKQCNCELVDEPNYTEKDNFIYQGHQYSFATFVFRKADNVR